VQSASGAPIDARVFWRILAVYGTTLGDFSFKSDDVFAKLRINALRCRLSYVCIALSMIHIASIRPVKAADWLAYQLDSLCLAVSFVACCVEVQNVSE
jgi:hypothetical protein